MKIAIHQRDNSFSKQWIRYCEENDIKYKIVNCFDNDIIFQLEGFDIVMWHHHHAIFEDTLAAKNILLSLEHSGKIVYPNWKSQWHFDNKVAQKYLLEAIGAPLVKSFVFYNKEKALDWAKTTKYPKVFKLKGGAGAKNVLMINDFKSCKKLIKKAFGKGFLQYSIRNAVIDDVLRFKKTKKIIYLLKAIGRYFVKPQYAKKQSRDRGYFYIQEFIPFNSFDIRLIVIGGKYVYGMRRINRKGDFRASGSNHFEYDNIPIEAVKVALKTAKSLDMQSVAFDFVFQNDKPLIVEISYGFGTKGSSKSPGYWDERLNWNQGEVKPEDWILESVLLSSSIKKI